MWRVWKIVVVFRVREMSQSTIEEIAGLCNSYRGEKEKYIYSLSCFVKVLKYSLSYYTYLAANIAENPLKSFKEAMKHEGRHEAMAAETICTFLLVVVAVKRCMTDS